MTRSVRFFFVMQTVWTAIAVGELIWFSIAGWTTSKTVSFMGALVISSIFFAAGHLIAAIDELARRAEPRVYYVSTHTSGASK